MASAEHQKQRLTIPTKEIFGQIYRYTVPLYTYEDDMSKKPHPNGGGVLFEYDGNRYIFSAAHVIHDENFGKTFFGLNDHGRVSSIGGKYYSVAMPVEGNHRYEHIDAALVRLNESTVFLLVQAGYRFLNIERINTMPDLTKTDVVLVAGYPHSKRRIRMRTSANVYEEPFSLLTAPRMKDLSQIGFPLECHHFAHYPKKKLLHTSATQRLRGPHPEGLSGTGLWLTRRHVELGVQYYLIGIQTTYLKNRNLFVSTKIDLFIETIKAHNSPQIPNYGWRPVFRTSHF
jgi:hypothetical protein